MVTIEMIIAEKDNIMLKYILHQDIDFTTLRKLCTDFVTDFKFDIDAPDSDFFKSVCSFLNSYK